MRPPGMILPIALAYFLFGPSPFWGLAWVLLGSLLLVPLVGALAEQLDPRPEAVVMGWLLAAFLPTLLFTSAGIWSEPPSLFFSLLALYLVVRARRVETPGRTTDLLLAGAALGFGYLVRPAVGPVIALLLLLFAGEALYHRRGRAAVMAFALAVALPIAAWGVRNYLVFGELFFGNTESTAALYGANNPVSAGIELPAIDSANGVDLHAEQASGAFEGSWIPLTYLHHVPPDGLSEMERHRFFKEAVKDFVVEHPGEFAELVAHKLMRVLTAEPMPPSILAESPGRRRLKHLVTLGERWFVLLFGGAGLVMLLRRRDPRLVPYLLFLAGSFAVVVIAYVNARIFLPVTGVLLAPAAVSLGRVLHRVAPSTP
jgi:4-amino-4-deoxy-L-arabinose transferase-like glycosyltransferase